MARTDELDERMARMAAGADALRTVGLKGLERVTLARQVSLEREQERLSQELGAEHPRVSALAARLRDGVARLDDLRLDIARAQTAAPRAEAAEWVLHGYVFSAEKNAAPGLTVFLVDEKGEWLRGLGQATTDARGYFLLRATVDAPATPSAALSGGAAPRAAFVRITDASRSALHRGAKAVAIVPGQVQYLEVLLDAPGGAAAAAHEEVPEPAGPPNEPAKKARRRG